MERLVGFCMAYRADTAARVGPWDERFGVGNFEDNDYCLRTRLLGLQCVVAEGCYLHHEGGATFKGENVDYWKLMQRNRELFLQKWSDPQLALLPSLLQRLGTQPAEVLKRVS